MKKSYFTPALLALAAASMAVSASAAGFAKTQTYTAGQFPDVPAAEWYAAEVKNTFELGLMKGDENGNFNPEGSVTVAEALTMACRAHSIYNGTEIPSADGEWYQMYVDYAAKNGFGIETEDYDRPALRYEVAEAFKKAMPADYFTAQNDVKRIPDVSKKQPYETDLITLYNAGIVMGSDEWGNFRPMDNITRAESAAIINRVALPENRLKKTLSLYSEDDAYQLNYNTSFDAWGNKEGISSGWTLDNRGGSPRTSLTQAYGALSDVSKDLPTAMIREFNNTTTGLLVHDQTFTVSVNNTGAYLEYRNKDDKPVYRLEVKDNAWQYLGESGKYTKVYPIGKNETVFVFTIKIDLDNNRSTTVINGKDTGTYPLATSGADTNIQNFRYGTTDASTSVITSTGCRINVNYAYYGSVLATANATNTVEVRPVSGIAVVESKYNLSSGQPINVGVYSGTHQLLSFTNDENNYYANGEKVYDNYVKNLWYRFRFELDTENQIAKIKVNGRYVGEVPFAEPATSIDNVRFINYAEEGDVRFDDLHIFEWVQHDDYVPVPVIPKGEEKYNVMLNICSMWHNGIHFGWSCISPFDDIEPVLGYYDEGNPELADWEIKYMVEHGIDCQAFCFFPDYNTAPLYAPSNSTHLFEGYMNAKYSDMMHYCLIWEASSGSVPRTMDQWKQFYVPYFIEQFFRDPRYMVIDNKPIMYVFGVDNLILKSGASKGFDNAEIVREAFDYLEEEVKKLGFDGMIYVASNTGSSRKLADEGFDAAAPYNFGSDAYAVDHNKLANINNSKDKNMFYIPSVAVGFNNVAWTGATRYPMMTAEDFLTTNLWLRDEFSIENKPTENWQKNLFHVCTWNEFGEGTYICPCEGLNGFGYLDALREVYTDEKADPSLNLVPTAEQKKRINRLYPQHKHLMRKKGDYVDPKEEIAIEDYDTVLTVLPGTHPGGINAAGITDFNKSADGYIDGTTAVADNYLAFGNGNSLDLEAATLVKVNACIQPGQTLELYFTTQADQSWNTAKAASTTKSETDEATDYYFDMHTNPNWKGTLLWYRFDPANTSGMYFRINSIEFLGTEVLPADQKSFMIINDTEVTTQLPPQKTERGDYLFAFDPKVSMDFLFNAYYTWDKDAGVFTLYIDKHTLVYTVGSDKYTLDGREKSLGYTMYLFDGLPMLPLAQFCSDVGFKYTMTDKGPSITTTEGTVKKDFFDAKNDRIPYSWEFNVNGDNEGWSSGAMSLLTADGYLSCESNSQHIDPMLNRSISAFPADKYHTLTYRVRYDYQGQMTQKKDEDGNPIGDPYIRDEALTMYFATSEEPGLSEGKTIKLTLKGTSSDGEWEEYTAECFDNKSWKGNITQLRFDPFNSWGHIDIDYIRFVEDPQYEIELAKPKPFSITNGDAEGETVGFISHNAKVQIVEDPLEDDHCYLFTSGEDKQNWVYAIMPVHFNTGKTYKIDYDIMFAGTGTGTFYDPDVKSHALCNFQFKNSGATDHVVEGSSATLAPDTGWIHVSRTYTCSIPITDHSGDRFTVFSNPVGDTPFNFYLDNVVVVELED